MFDHVFSLHRVAGNMLEISLFHVFVRHKWLGINFGKAGFQPIFLPNFGPRLAHFQGISGFFRGDNQPPRHQNMLKPPLVFAYHVVKDNFPEKVSFWPLVVVVDLFARPPN